MATFGLVLLVAGTAFVAHVYCRRRESSPFLTPYAGGQLSFVDSIGSPLMIDEAARPEFRDSKKARTL